MKTERMVRVSSKGQIVLPKRFRDQLGIATGDYLLVKEMKDGALRIEKSEAASELDRILEPLRQEAKKQGFTRAELMKMIKSMRKERKANAA
jgi:AbrB family looped-hinge helix DNA binding protein